MLNALRTTEYDRPKTKTKPAFGNLLASQAVTGALSTIKGSAVLEAAFLDGATMVAPRTIIDYQQNPDYGKETFRREFSAMLINPFMPGVVGMALLAGKGKWGLYTNEDTLRTLGEAWKKSNGNEREYIKTVFKNTRGLVGETNTPEAHLGDKLDNFADKVVDLMKNGGKKRGVLDEFTRITGASETLEVRNLGEKPLRTNINDLVRDTISAAEKVFKKTAPGKLDDVISDLARFSKIKSAAAVGATVATGLSLQYFNAKITEKSTGCSDFAGYKDFGKDKTEEKPKKNKTRLRLLKGAAVAGIVTLAAATMGGFSRTGGFFRKGGLQNFMKAIELRDEFAHVDVIKTVYASVIAGRFISSRDETELKTSVVRDSAGFMNWLVLGPFVAKGVASAAKRVTGINILNGEIKGDTFFKKIGSWFSDLSLKSSSEIGAMIKKAPESATKLRALHNGSQLAGLGYAMFALGIGMPILINKFIINKSKQGQTDNKKESMSVNIASTPIPFGKRSLLDYMGEKASYGGTIK